MLRSMTGFGRGEYSNEECSVTAEIRSVNHRYCDISVKMPHMPYTFQFVEDATRKAIREYIFRGKVECKLTIELLKSSNSTITLNRDVMKQYLNCVEEMKQDFGIGGDLTVETATSLPGIFDVEPTAFDEKLVLEACTGAATEAAKNLSEMRLIEGEKLAKDLLMRGGLIRQTVEEIEKRSFHVPEEYRDKLHARINDLLSNTSVEIPEDRLAVEVAVFADKANITEELIRLKSHLDQLNEIVGSDEEVSGKKLDFLVQEMNREVNTIGSKANDLDVTNLVLSAKAEVEKIREQVQNIE